MDRDKMTTDDKKISLELTRTNNEDDRNKVDTNTQSNEYKTRDFDRAHLILQPSLTDYLNVKSGVWNSYRSLNDTTNVQHSEIEKLFVKSDLLGSLREILERNVNANTEALKYNLNKMLRTNSDQTIVTEQSHSGKINEFNKEEILFIEEQVDKILVEAQVLVNGLLNKNFDEVDYRCKDYSLNALCDDLKLIKTETLPPQMLEEHILEAPEGFRTHNEQILDEDDPLKDEPDELNNTGLQSLLVEEVKCHSDAVPVEPERPVVTNHGHDNKAAQEVDTCRRAEAEEMKTCENDTATTYVRDDHANSTAVPKEGNGSVAAAATSTVHSITVGVVANGDNELEKEREDINGIKVVKFDDASVGCKSFQSANNILLCGMRENGSIMHSLFDSNKINSLNSTISDCIGRTDVNNQIKGNYNNQTIENDSNIFRCKSNFDTLNEADINVHKIGENEPENSVINTISEKLTNTNNSDTDDVGKSSFKRKTLNLSVSDKPKFEVSLEQFHSKKKLSDISPRKLDRENKRNTTKDNNNVSDVKAKSLFNLIVTDKPRKKLLDKTFSDKSDGNIDDKYKSSGIVRNEANEDDEEDNNRGVVEVRHVGLTTTSTTPTHLRDTSNEKVNCCIECRNGNDTTTTTTTTKICKNEHNLKDVVAGKVDINDCCHCEDKDVMVSRCSRYPADTAPDSVTSKSTATTSPSTITTPQSSSIETGVLRCAELPGCSRESTVSARVAFDTFAATKQEDIKITENDGDGVTVENGRVCLKKPDNISEELAENRRDAPPVEHHLTWSFKNGRLVFEDAVVPSSPENERESENANIPLTSKELNRKAAEGRQLKLLEEKLKRAGIVDEIKSKSERLSESKIENNDENIDGGDDEDSDDLIPEEYGSFEFCEFDPNNTNLAGIRFDSDADFYLVYDELLENESLNGEMRGEGGMGTNVDRKQHNPDHDNLKSLLKKPGHGARDAAKKNRVVFNETKNEFFDADYIILIREECDYDDEDDDGMCTCNQHEMVRLTCCEPNCNCNVYDGYVDTTPQSPKFAPPLEFVDSVTLSPPEEYKDMELEEQHLMALQQIARRTGQQAPVCRECSASHEDEGDGSQSDNEEGVTEIISDHDEAEEKEKTDQSQQTTPTTPPADSDATVNNQRYILETLSMTTVTERQVIKEIEDKKPCLPPNIQLGGSPISGILKGGRLWKHPGAEINNQAKVSDLQQMTDSNVTSDEESGSRRSVRFSESRENNQRDVCDGAPDKITAEETKPAENESSKNQQEQQTQNSLNMSASPESTEMMLTFKLGNHVLISNNSLKPNSAVRQLFPCTKPLSGKIAEDDTSSVHQYLVTAESLRAFEEAKRSKLPQIIQSGETDDSIRRAIERNTLRRSLIRYEPRSRKPVQKTDNSLVERIKQLTCNVEEDLNQESDEISQRASPPGEEARNSPEVVIGNNKIQDKNFSPSSSSTTSSNSSSMSSTCRKFTDLFAKREKTPDIQNVNEQIRNNQSMLAPDLGNGPQEVVEPPVSNIVKSNPVESKKQFLSTLAPLTACVSGIGPTDDYYHMNNHNTGDRTSIASSVGTEYSLEDIDEVLRKDEEETKKIAPDVLAGTPSASESGDELAMFVQQDAGRIERIKKKYQPETAEEDDEHDDYGFNRRPSVRGIKPRFGSTTEILQQIQNQMQPPNNTPPRNHVAWPYYSETNLTGTDNTKIRNINQNLPPYPYPPTSSEDNAKRTYVSHQYRPNSYIEENIYQNCANQRCTQSNYRTNMNYYPTVMRVDAGYTDYYTSLPRNRTGRPQSPPPQEVSKNFHQTMVYIPYNHIEGYHPMSPNPCYTSANDPCYARVTSQNQINKRYLDPTYQQRISQPVEDHYQKTILRSSYPSANHLVSSRSESPLPGQFSTARSTQTPAAHASACSYYPARYRPMIGPATAIPPNGLIWQGEGNYVSKINRQSFPRYPPSDSISLTDSDSQHSGQMPNGYRQVDPCYNVQKDSMPNSPTKPRFIERGVPEGAASVSPQDSVNAPQSTSTMTSPTSPQNPPAPPAAKPLFYAMNV